MSGEKVEDSVSMPPQSVSETVTVPTDSTVNNALNDNESLSEESANKKKQNGDTEDQLAQVQDEDVNGKHSASETNEKNEKEQKQPLDKDSVPHLQINTEDSNNYEAADSIRSAHAIDRASIHPSQASSPVKRRSLSSVHVNEAAGIAFLKNSLESIISIKEIMKKHQNLVQCATTAIGTLKSGEMPSEEIIFEPLRLACEQSNDEAKILALDCLSKIFTFNIFNQPIYIKYKNLKPILKTDADMDVNIESSNASEGGKVLLIEAAIQTINSCFEGEGTDENVELQVIRVLTGAVVNESMPVHGKVLLQAVRQIYNIFLLSLSPINQGIAQASLVQIVNIVFDKVKKLRSKGPPLSVDIAISEDNSNGQVMTLQQLEDNIQNTDNIQLNSDEIFGNDDELFVKDAFLMFRSMSNLAVKVIEMQSIDMRSHAIRSKLLSLHIIYWILKNHMDVFVNKGYLLFNKNSSEKTNLVDGIRKYLCLALSRNAASQLPTVYEITLEIYWQMIGNMRGEFKYEIPVFLDEIYLPVSEMKTSSAFQKRYILEIVCRLCSDPKALIELYLNYDCDASLPNVCEQIVDYLTKYALARVEATLQQKINYRNSKSQRLSTFDFENVPELNVSKMTSHPPNPDLNINYPLEYGLKMTSIECIISFLHSLNLLSGQPIRIHPSNSAMLEDLKSVASSARARGGSTASSALGVPPSPDVSSANLSLEPLNEESADAQQFDTLKQRKTALIEGIKLFNFSPKRGIPALIRTGFIEKDNPESIAKFILDNDTLDKTTIGEYLGGGKDDNIAAMHAFVDALDFKQKGFLEALRNFLQHFRLPGESQVIDRFMLKFAEKYVNDNPTTFANADTVYVLSYSVIMLNTDQHSPQVKKRMTLDDFIKNNRGIDDGKDLDPNFLEHVYTDIQGNEIILNSEQQAALISNNVPESQPITTGLFGGRDLAKEAYTKASKAMTTKTEQAVRSLRIASKRNVFYRSDATSNPDLVRSMFDTLWMSLLAGLTPPFKDYDDEDTARLLLDGILLSIHLSCLFGLDYARTSFVRALVQFTNINNPEDLKNKNIEAIYTLLEVATDESSYLKNSWKDIFVVISQLERLKLLSKGVDSTSVPDLINARFAHKDASLDINSRSEVGGFFSFGKKQSISRQTFQHHFNQKLPVDMISKINSTELDVAIDKVFSKSSEIVGDGIFDFINGLTEVAREEIESSGQSNEPRMFCLQKMVDVCYYNMGRIRVQWSELWKTMNEQFNQFGCNPNTVVAFFAIDSLRQLSERFFNIEELSHFKFQKDFLKPFDYIIVNNSNLAVREMVLDCVQYLIVKKVDHIRSGWTTLLQILTHASLSEDSEKFVAKGFQYVKKIVDDHLDSIERENAFEDLVVCLTEYAKNENYQKTSLRALSTINNLVEKIGKDVDNHEYDDDHMNKLWFPLLFSFNDVIMEGNDLEVRSQALNFMFDALMNHGKQFDSKFWDRISNELLFPIFNILKKHGEININHNEDLWVWLSSTLIQAMRRMILLFTSYFDVLHKMMDGYLGLLVSCICQDNEAISKIGISCLEELILQNMHKFQSEHWGKIDFTFTELFKLTRADELFDFDPLKKKKKIENKSGSKANGEEHAAEGGEVGEGEEEEDEDDEEEEEGETYSESTNDSRFTSQSIVIKCVLQLHMIQILSELFDNDDFYHTIPVSNLMKLADLLHSSYAFAKNFNKDYDLRVRLWNAGVVEKLPNLLKQETSAVGVYISIMFRLYCDSEKVDDKDHDTIVDILMPLAVSLLKRCSELDEREETRNLQSWMPVIVEILQACTEFDEKDFVKCSPMIYDLVLTMFDKNMSVELRGAVKDFLGRVGEIYVLKA